jgi:peptidoglycan/LPS O-acetylase OafA/YrhL
VWHKALTWQPLQHVGKFSYGMYVFHKPLHDQLGPRLQSVMGLTKPGITTTGVYLVALTALVYALAWLSYTLFEVHFLRLKARLT